MTHRRFISYIASDDAILGQPISLLIVFVIASVIITVLCVCLQPLLADSEFHQVEGEINKILIEAANMFEYADHGSCMTIHVEFPESVRFIVFGQLPTNITNEIPNLTSDETTSNNCYVVMKDGTVRTYHSNVRFSNHNLTQCFLLHSGAYDITIEVCQKEGVSYVAMAERYP